MANKKTYEVTFTRFGTVTISAESRELAMHIADGYGEDDISWSDCIEVTDIYEPVEVQ